MTARNDLGAELRAALARGDVLAGDAVPELAVDGQAPSWVCRPDDAAEMQACMRAAAAAGAAVVPAGLGARLDVGRPPERMDIIVSTRRMNRIVAHEAADMTIVVEAGATLAEIDAALEPHGQRLPLDPPLPERTTVGGLIAADAFGPRRLSLGKVRDALIGVKAVLADGALIKGGGRVVKNVAGYDLMKLLCGSHGTLAVIVEAAFKLRPRPTHLRVGVARYDRLEDAFAAAMRLATLAVAPAFARVLSGRAAGSLGHDGPVVVVGVEGSAAEVDAIVNAVEAVLAAPTAWDVGEGAEVAYAAARDAQLASADDELAARCSLLPGDVAPVVAEVLAATRNGDVESSVVADLGCGVVFFAIHRGCEQAVLRLAESARRAATQRGGFVVLPHRAAALADRLDPWGEAPGLARMRGIKDALDPQHRLSPGRFVAGVSRKS